MSKKKLIISCVIGILGLILITLVAILLKNVYNDYKIKTVAESYVLNWDSGKTAEQFSDKLNLIGNDEFKADQLNTDIDFYTKRIDSNVNIKNTIEKILLIDRQAVALQAVVYYSEKNLSGNYANEKLASIVMYRENGKWLIQSAYILDRSGKVPPATAKEEEKVQADRNMQFQGLLAAWTEARSSGNSETYKSFFSQGEQITDNATQSNSLVTPKDKQFQSIPEYTKLFEDEQNEVKTKKLDFKVVDDGILVVASSDTQARVMLLNGIVINGFKKPAYVMVDLVNEWDQWKILNLYGAVKQ